MIIEFGNNAPYEIIDGEIVRLPGPAVTRVTVEPNVNEEGNLEPGYTAGTDATEMLRHFAANPGPVKHLGGNELVQEVIDTWSRHSDQAPAWVNVTDPTPYEASDMADFERLLEEYWGCERGAPDDVEASHFTQYGNTLYAPGEEPPDEVKGFGNE